MREPASIDIDIGSSPLLALDRQLGGSSGAARPRQTTPQPGAKPRFLGAVPSQSRPRPEATVAQPDYLPVAFLSLGAERARAVVHLEYDHAGKAYFGTGFMVSPTLMLTNHHVFPSAEAARGAKIFFDHEADAHGRPRRPAVFRAAPERLFLASEALDFALVAIADDPGREWGFVELRHNPRGLAKGERVNLIQHPKGELKQVVLTGNHIVDVGEVALRYLADTEGGSSGSPVFNQRWELVGLHHLGSARENVGVRCDRILEFLTAAHARRERSPLLTELLATVPDSGELGWFASAGLRGPEAQASAPKAKRSSPEAQALAWRGGPDFLDLTHWRLDTGAVEGAGAPGVEALADALECLGSDLALVDGLSPERAPQLSARLRERELGVVALGAGALLCRDPAVELRSRKAGDATGDPGLDALLGARMRGRPVIPAKAMAAFDVYLRRPGDARERRFVLLAFTADLLDALPSRLHRNELARLLCEHGPRLGGDVVVLGPLGGVIEQPAFAPREDELAVLGEADPPRRDEAATMLWLGDGRGPSLDAIHSTPSTETLRASAGVMTHAASREWKPPSSLQGGALLLTRLCFNLEQDPQRDPARAHAAAPQVDPGKTPAPAPGASPPAVDADTGRQEWTLDARVQSIIVVTQREADDPDGR